MNHRPNVVKYDHLSLSERLKTLVGNTLGADCTFIIEDEDDAEIPAHKLIVGLASPVLNRIVYGNDSFPPTETIKVDGISKKAFTQILHYIYSDAIEICDDNVFQILNKSNYFGLPGIELKCFEYLEKQLNVSTVPWIYHQLTYAFSSSNVLKKCLQYIRLQPKQFFNSVNFEKLSVDGLRVILEMDAINCNEIDLFEAVIKISRAHCVAAGLEITAENQRLVLGGAERLLRLETLDDEIEFANCLEAQKDFFSSNEIKTIRSEIVKSSKTTEKRKWFTYQDAVWIEVEDDLPPSAFRSGSEFIYRCCEGNQLPQVADKLYELALDENLKTEVLCGSGYEWRRCVNGEIPFGAVPITKEYSEPVFIARAKSTAGYFHIGPALANGTMPDRGQLDHLLYQPRHTVSPFDILVANNVKHPYRGSGVPDDAIFIGCDHNNYNIYLGRAWHNKDLLPTKVILQLGAFVPYGTKEIRVGHFEFVRLDPGTYTWKQAARGEVPPNAIVGGHTINNEILYYGRVFHNGNYIPGKVHPSHEVLYVPYNGRELHFRFYEVLVENVIC